MKLGQNSQGILKAEGILNYFRKTIAIKIRHEETI